MEVIALTHHSMRPPTIQRRKVRGKEYELVLFPGPMPYVIYEIRHDTDMFAQWPLVASFDNEQEAVDFLMNLSTSAGEGS
jgi:hypothetical protein